MTDFFQIPGISAVQKPPHEPAHEPALGAGAMLRQAREAAGLNVATLAVAMKVPVRKLEALEVENFGELGDRVYVRAFAASMCRALKLDPTPILDKLPKTLPPRLDVQERGINSPFQSHSAISVKAAARFLTRPAVLLVLLLLAGAVVLLFLPEINSSPIEAETAKPKFIPIPTAATAPAAPTATTAPTVAAVPKAAPAPTSPVSPIAPATATNNVAQVPKPASSALATGRAPAPVLASSAAKPAPASVVVTPTAPPPTGPALVRFTASASSWVRVADRTGKVQLERNLEAGETGQAWGELPLSVVVGNVAATTVQVRGKAFLMDGIARDNVARFEVK